MWSNSQQLDAVAQACNLWEAKVDRLLEPRSLRLAWEHGETPSLQKIPNLAGHGGVHLQSQLLKRPRWEISEAQDVEAAVS